MTEKTTTPDELGAAHCSAEKFVAEYAAENISREHEHSEHYHAPTGQCAQCEHWRRGLDSCTPDDGDWCHLDSGAFGDERWHECPAWRNAQRSGGGKGDE